ncbi:MAG: prepilin-type N-terminal cleavage/methylation domain-containing protein [Patescibacteria group bacterium]
MSKGEKGFTIIEILISLAVFALAIPAIAISIRNLVVLNNRARDLALINIIASNKAEQVRSAGFNSLSPGTVDFSSELSSEISSPKSASYTVTIPNAGEAVITFDISYRDYNKTRTLTYKTIVSELGVGQ